MVTPWEEDQLLHDVMDGLRVAIHESNVNVDHLNSIKLNKLVYFAAREFDLPVTYSWFKYGASLSDTSVDTEYIEPVSLDELPNPGGPRIGQEWEYPSPREYEYFFLENVDLEHIFSETTKDYLEEFYHGYAPEEFAELYADSAVLQKTIDEILDMDLDDFNSRLSEISDQVQEEVRELNIELIMHEEIDDGLVDKFTAYTEVLLEIFENISREGDEIDSEQFAALRSVLKFYYSHAWKYVALDISEKTVTGPSERDLLKATVNELDKLEKNLEHDIQNVRQRCVDSGLIEPRPDVTIAPDRPIPDGDYDEIEGAIERVEERREERDYESMDTDRYLRD